MQLFLVQHGHALDESVDPDRPLSDRGRDDVARVASFLTSAGVLVADVQHSGKTRARQTAEILAAVVQATSCDAVTGLAPNDAVAPVLSEVRDTDRMLVGHQPFMGRAASMLLAGREEPVLVAFEPGAVLCLVREEHWRVAWMIVPRLLAR